MMREQLLQEFDLETKYIREHLVRVPNDKLTWKPHEKSMSLKQLAGFLSVVFRWTEPLFTQPDFDASGSLKSLGTDPFSSADAILALFDKTVADARVILAAADETTFADNWKLHVGEQLWFEQPKWLVWRTYVMNHAVHHRAQLGVFLRLLNVPVPAVYNDSADEKGGMFR